MALLACKAWAMAYCFSPQSLPVPQAPQDSSPYSSYYVDDNAYVSQWALKLIRFCFTTQDRCVFVVLPRMRVRSLIHMSRGNDPSLLV